MASQLSVANRRHNSTGNQNTRMVKNSIKKQQNKTKTKQEENPRQLTPKPEPVAGAEGLVPTGARKLIFAKR